MRVPSPKKSNGCTYPSAQTVTGVAGSISTIAVTLNNWTDNTTSGNFSPGDADREMMLVFQPAGCNTTSCLQTFQFLGGFGSFENLSNETVTFEDSATNYAPDAYDGQGISGDKLTNPGTYKPTVNDGASTYCSGETQDTNATFQSPDPVSTAPCATDNPTSPNNNSDGNATFGSQFSGSPNGTWTLYIETWHNGTDAQATIGGWTLTITVQANAVNTTTTMSSNQTNNETFEGTSVTLTATVTSTSTVGEGTVDFTDNGSTISGCGAVAVSSGQAQCTTSFSIEGNHPLGAQYTGDANFGNSTGNMNFFVDHAITTTSTPGQYCNTGTMTINTSSDPGTTPYPQHIFVPSTVTGTVSDVSLLLPNVTIGGIAFFNLLLVDPNGNKFVPLAGTGGFGNASNVTLTLSDFGGSTVPNPSSGAPASGTYLPTDDNTGLTFASSPDGPPAGPYLLPQNQGGATFDTTFAGSSAAGMWSLYAYYASGDSTGSIGGYCLNLTTSSAAATTTTVTSSPLGEATTGTEVTFAATVKSGGNPVASGTVTFKENGTVLSGPTAVDPTTGQVSFQTSSLSEGIHTITSNYSGVSGTYNVSSGSVTIEIDTATTIPSSGQYCNAGGISISGSNTGTNVPATPYPSRVNVTNLAGTVQTVGVALNNFSDGQADSTAMLLVGPTSTNIVFWNGIGGDNAFSSLNLTIADSAGSGNPIPAAPETGMTYYPTADLDGLPTPVFPAPAPGSGSLSFAPAIGSQTFATAFGANGGINGNGFWSLYVYDRFGSNPVSVNNWCLNFVENPPVLSISKSHTGDFTQGDTADTYTITVSNPSGPGSTAGTLTLTDTLPSGMTVVSMTETGNSGGGTGSDWSCTGTACTRTTPMPSGESDTITLTVGVSYSTPTGTNAVTNSVSVSGGGISASQTANDPTTINAGTGYTLTTSVNPSGGGTIAASPTNSTGLMPGHYVPGAQVMLTANPNTGFSFQNWSGSTDLSSTSTNPTMITMNSATESVTANLNQTVSVTVDALAGSTHLQVSVDGGAPQTGPLMENWVAGSQHTIATTSPQGSNGTQYTFQSWSDSGAISHSVMVPATATSYTATFSTAYQLTTGAHPAAGGTVGPASRTYYASGTVVNLTATPNSGYTFSNWTGSVANANSASTTVTMTAPQTLTANFARSTVQVMVGTNPSGPSFSVDGITYTSAQSFSWTIGTNHTLSTTSPQTATGTTYAFQSWSDAGAITHMVMAPSSAATYTATFSVQYQLTTAVSPVGSGTLTPTSGSYYPAGSVVSVKASPHAGYIFQHWTGNVASTTSASTTVTMNAPESVTANFTEGTTHLGGLLVNKQGPESARKWTFGIFNTGPGAANGAAMSSFNLTQTSGKSCSPHVVTSIPIALGNLAPEGATATTLTINFSGCSQGAKFTVGAGLTANQGKATGSILERNQEP